MSSKVFRIEKIQERKVIPRMQWSKLYDICLNQLIENNALKSWKEIARAMNSKFPEVEFTAKRCRSRWKNCINPVLCRHYLTNAEELIVLAYHSSCKNQWSRIALYLSHRHSNFLRNSFHSTMKKFIKTTSNVELLLSEVTGLEFLQFLYIGTYLIELLEVKEKPKGKNCLVPVYIYKQIQESSVNKEKCTKITLRYRDLFVQQHSGHPELQLLKQFSYQSLANEFLKNIVLSIKTKITSNMNLCENYILELIKHVTLSTFSNDCAAYSTATTRPSPISAGVYFLPYQNLAKDFYAGGVPLPLSPLIPLTSSLNTSTPIYEFNTDLLAFNSILHLPLTSKN